MKTNKLQIECAFPYAFGLKYLKYHPMHISRHVISQKTMGKLGVFNVKWTMNN
jgi:hypothetical protein